MTDADAEYSGAGISTIEQAMRRTMADALRLASGDVVRALAALRK